MWEYDGEEHLETVALGCPGRDVYVRMADARYQLRAVWLDAADITRWGRPALSQETPAAV